MRTIEIEKALELENVIFIDVRTESEYKEDNILDAFNMPVFNDDEHGEVGTIYKLQGKHEAIQKGFDYVAVKLKDMYLQITSLASEYDNIVIYCARGGMRSTSVANMLSAFGMNIYKLEGGYKSYRNYVMNYLESAMNDKEFIVIHGLTGAGKTDLLKMLEKDNVPIIDLEGIAQNSGSVFGYITFDEKPPSQRKFETKIFEKLFFTKGKYLFIESESKRVGNVVIPPNVYEGIVRDGYHILLECSIKSRVSRLSRDYIHERQEGNKEALKECISKFKKRLGKEVVERYISLLEEERYEELVENYLVNYYDPLYMHSVDKYKYNQIINFDDEELGKQESISFYKAAMEGAIKC